MISYIEGNVCLPSYPAESPEASNYGNHKSHRLDLDKLAIPFENNYYLTNLYTAILERPMPRAMQIAIWLQQPWKAGGKEQTIKISMVTESL